MERGDSGTTPAKLLPFWACVLLFAVMYFAAAELGRWLSLEQNGFVTFWVPSGLYLAVLLRSERRCWPPLVLAAVLANVTFDRVHGKSWAVCLGFAAANTLEALAAAWAIGRVAGSSFTLARLQDLWKCTAVVVLFSAPLGAVIGAATVAAAFEKAPFGATWTTWWIADVVGVLVAMPVVLALIRDRATPFPARVTWLQTAEVVVTLLAVAATVHYVFGAAADEFPMPVVMVPPLLWISLRFGWRGVALAMFAIALITVADVKQDRGPFIGPNFSPAMQVFRIQSFLSFSSLAFLALAAVFHEKQQIERTLRNRERRHLSLATALGEMVWMTGPKGEAIYPSEDWTTLTGQTQGQSSDEGWLEALHPDDREIARERWHTALATEQPYAVEFRVRSVKGTWRTMDVRGLPVRDEAGQVREWIGVLLDVTQHKEIEESLRQSNSILAGISRVQAEFLVESNPQDSFERMLALLLECTGSEYGFIGEILYPSERPPYLRTLAITNIAWDDETRAIYSRSATAGIEFHNLHTLFGRVITSRAPVIANDPATNPFKGGLPPGHPPLRAFLGLPILHGGQLTGIVSLSNRPGGYDEATIKDLAHLLNTCSNFIEAYRNEQARLQAERSLKDAREILMMIVNNIPQGVFWKDRHSRYLGCNDVILRAFGVDRLENILGKTDRELPCLSREQADFFIQKDREVMEAGQPIYGILEQGSLADGSTIWMETNKVPMRDAQGSVIGLLGTWQDITKRTQAELERQRSQEFVQTVLTAAGDGIVSIDAKGCIRSFNRSAEQIFGYPASEAIGKNVSLLIPEPHHSHHDEYLARYLRTGQARIIGTSRELEGLRKDGSTFPLEIRVSEFRFEGERLFLGVLRDATERKKMEDQLRQSQKMEAVGQLAGGIAHDFNNLLTVITGFTDLVLSSLPPADSNRESLTQVQEASERAASLTHQLLAFSRKQVLQPRLLDLNNVLRDCEKILRRLIGEDIALTCSLPPLTHRIKADPSQIEQVVMNLAINARDAMPNGGTLTIATHEAELSVQERLANPELSPGLFVMLSISDTGCGMTAAVKARIFEPFYTTKEKGKGTGLGLATVYGIIKQSGGFIAVESEVGTGTAFCIGLPAVAVSPTASDAEGVSAQPIRGHETVLLVEDEPSLREMARIALSRCGYRVMEAENGRQALEVVEQQPRPIDILITDVVMPEMSGRQLAERLVSIHPKIEVLFMSGYTDDAVMRHGILEHASAFLQKPFSPVALARKVRSVLDGRDR